MRQPEHSPANTARCGGSERGMKTKPYMMAVAVLAVAGITTAGEKVAKQELPKAVHQTLESRAATGDVKHITKRTEAGRTVYEVTFAHANGDDTKLVIAADGRVLANATPRSAAVNISPAASSNPAAEPGMGAGETIVTGTATPAANNVAATTPGSDRVVADTESRLSLDEVPDAVRNTIEAEARGREVADIDRETHEDRPVYEVEFREQGINEQIHVEEDGTLVRDDGAIRGTLRNLFSGTQVTDTPQVVQDVIKQELDGREIADIDKERRSGRVVYEVEVDDAEGQFQLHIAEDGTIVKDGRIAAE